MTFVKAGRRARVFTFGQQADQWRERAMPTKILCATDGTGHGSAAVAEAARMAAKYGAELTLCTVNVMRGGGRGAIMNDMEDSEVTRILDEAVALAKGNGAAKATAAAILSREAAAGIVAYADEKGYDHIVVGTGDKRGISRLVLGSVAADVAARAHCPVTVVR